MIADISDQIDERLTNPVAIVTAFKSKPAQSSARFFDALSESPPVQRSVRHTSVEIGSPLHHGLQPAGSEFLHITSCDRDFHGNDCVGPMAL